MKISRQVKNSLLNLTGGLIPGLIALLVLPKILFIHGDSFLSIYMLQIAILYIISLTDMGVSRVILLIKFDDLVNPGKSTGPPFIVAKELILKISILLALIFCLINIIYMFQSINYEIATANFLLILSGLISLNTLPCRSVLELEGRYLLLNILRGLSACIIYLAPLIFENNTDNLFIFISTVILISRILIYQVYRGVTSKHERCVFDGEFKDLKEIMFNRAKWIGLTNIISLGLTYVDRYVVALVVSVSAVASYTLSTELSIKLWLISGAVMSAVNPSIARNYFSNLKSNVSVIHLEKFIVYFGILLPAIIFIINSETLVSLWLKDDISSSVSFLSTILIVGISVNSLSQLNFSLLQLAGREKIGAYLQIYGFVFLVLSSTLFGYLYDEVGVAIAFSLRLILDALVVSFLISKEKGATKPISLVELIIVINVLILSVFIQ